MDASPPAAQPDLPTQDLQQRQQTPKRERKLKKNDTDDSNASMASCHSPDVMALCAESEKKLLEAVKTTVADAQIENRGFFQSLTDSHERQKRVSQKNATHVADLRKDVNQHEHDLQHAQQRIKSLEEKLHTMAIAPLVRKPEELAATDSRPFSGPIDSTILRVETHSRAEISLNTLKEYLDNLYSDANVKDSEFEVNGEPLGSKFVIQFLGVPGTAALKLNQALTCHKHKTGKYKELSVLDPTNQNVRILINRDENPAQVKTRRDAKTLGRIIMDAHPSLTQSTSNPNPKDRLFIKQADGRVCVGFKSLAQITPSPDGSPSSIKWNLTLAVAHDIDPITIQTAFIDARTARVEDVEWSSV